MDISSEILETLDIVGSKNVIEVLKDGVAEEDIILESEVAEDTEDSEVEEIIEIIEEIEECDESLPDNDASSKNKDTVSKKNGAVTKDEMNSRTIDKSKIYGFDEENSMFASPPREEPTKITNNTQKSSSKKQVIKYDVDEDWQDEDLERMEELDNSDMQAQVTSKNNKKHVNNQSVTLPSQSNRSDGKTHLDSMTRSDKSRMDSGIGNNVNNVEDNSDTHEIVKNVENNLLYTVLGTKKQDSSTKQQDAHYIKVGILIKHYEVTLIIIKRYALISLTNHISDGTT